MISFERSFRPRESALTSWYAVFVPAAAGHQLQIVDDDQTQLRARRLQPPQLGVHVHQVDAGGVVDVQRRLEPSGGGATRVCAARRALR